MGLRIRKSIKILPGVNLNLGTKSAGISIGGKAFRYSVNTSGRSTTTFKIPGTGISYSSSSRNKHTAARNKRQNLEKEKEKAAKSTEKSRQKQLELEHAQAAVEEYEAGLEAITTIHREVSGPYNWAQILETPAPFPAGTPDPREQEARKKMDSYKPGLLAKLFQSRDDSRNGKLETELNAAIEEDKKEYEAWEATHTLAQGVLRADPDAMLEAIEQAGIFQELAEYGSGFEIGFIIPSAAEVEFDIMADTVVPQESCSLTASGKLSQKKLAVSKRLDIMQDYVCSAVLRIARELFAIVPVDAVLIHAKDSFIDTSLGSSTPQDILSVLITRESLAPINFEAVDPSDSMVNFDFDMKFLKTKGFQPIQRLNVKVVPNSATGKEELVVEY